MLFEANLSGTLIQDYEIFTTKSFLNEFTEFFRSKFISQFTKDW